MTKRDSLDRLKRDIESCRACPRLVNWREAVAVEKRASFRHESYWGRPVSGFGDPTARLLIVGLAPAAHGANRTGRVFTGDRSGDWLFRALHAAGFANQATSTHVGDGLRLTDAYVNAAVRCAPPDNKPEPTERQNCQAFLDREVALLPDVQVVVALGKFAYDVACRQFRVSKKPTFAHLAEAAGETGSLSQSLTIVCSFHPSQQNTFTGRLTEPMFDAVFSRARVLLGPDDRLD